MMSDISIDGLATAGAPFRIGVAFNKTFSVLGRQFGRFILLTLVPMSPLLVSTLLLGSGLLKGQTVYNARLIDLLILCLQSVAQATTLYGAFQEMRGQPFTIGQSLRIGLTRALPVVGVALSSSITVSLGILLLLVPGLILASMIYVAVPVCVIEKRSVFASLSRSGVLTKGYRWQIFGVFLLVTVVRLIVESLLTLLGGGGIWAPLLNFAWQVLATTFSAVLVSVVYHDLRVAKEGIDIGTLASVFD
jgi:hypothetical protein